MLKASIGDSIDMYTSLRVDVGYLNQLDSGWY